MAGRRCPQGTMESAERIFLFIGGTMEFEAIYKKFSVPITRLAKKCRSYSNFINEEDVSQEMFIHLWQEHRDGKLQDKTDSYIIQSLWFCSKNYLRKKKDRGFFVSLDEPVNGEDVTLKDIIPDHSPSFTETLENEMFIQRIRDNGLSKREKDVFNLCLEGCNLREIGERLSISHVRVFKIRKSIREKISLKHKK